jgi:hypothetical protein
MLSFHLSLSPRPSPPCNDGETYQFQIQIQIFSPRLPSFSPNRLFVS